MLIHAGKCKWRDVYEVNRLYEHDGDILNRTYKVSWEGYPPEEDQMLLDRESTRTSSKNMKLQTVFMTPPGNLDATYVILPVNHNMALKFTKHGYMVQANGTTKSKYSSTDWQTKQ